MKKLMRLFAVALVAVGVSMAGVAYSAVTVTSADLNGTSLLPGQDGSVGAPFDFGALPTNGTFATLSVQLTGNAGDFFEHYANFTADGDAGSIVALVLNSITGNPFINNFEVEVWNNTHPGGSLLLGTFSGQNPPGTVQSLTLLGGIGTQYHLDISGVLAQGATQGQYSISLAVPEPEVYAMLVAGLGLMGFVARRRKQYDDAVV